MERIVAVEGREHFENALAQGRGVIVATAHLGSFEVGMASLADRPTPVHVVFQHDRRSGFERIRQALHEKIGVQEAPVEHGWDTWMKLRDALGRGEIVAIQADRVMPGQKGVAVPFCGGHVLLPLGPVKLARLVGSPIVPIYSVREGRGVRILIDPAIVVDPASVGAAEDIPPALVKLAASLERRIAAHPAQWLALHKAWQEDQASES